MWTLITLFQALDNEGLRIGAMDVHYGSRKMFMTSYANNKPGIFVVRWVRCRYGKGVRVGGGGSNYV